MITLTREPLILVPFASVCPSVICGKGHDVNSHLAVTIYHLNNTISSMTVQRVTLSNLLPGSILTFNGDLIKNRTIANTPNHNADGYDMYVSTKHNLEVGNMTNKYRLTVFYTDPKNHPISLSNFTAPPNKTLPTGSKTPSSATTNETPPTGSKTPSSATTNETPPTGSKTLPSTGTSIPSVQPILVNQQKVVPHPYSISQYYTYTFTWPIKTMDLTTLTYFWIVLIGVILSKLSTRIIYEKQQNKSNNPPPPTTTAASNSQPGPIDSLSNYDYLWIGISAIIALLIFSSFQQQVHLTGNILYNISLAFAFGFGFDRVLDTTSNLASKTH